MNWELLKLYAELFRHITVGIMWLLIGLCVFIYGFKGSICINGVGHQFSRQCSASSVAAPVATEKGNG